jgi:predicted NAD/FAD-dependent oxidoreductase
MKMTHPLVYDFLIVGAGICGLSLLKGLTLPGQNVLVLEKSKAIGGRMATRRDPPACYDHGAQHIKGPDLFTEFWSNELTTFPGLKVWQEGPKIQYAFKDGMNSFLKSHVDRRNIQLEKKVIRFEEGREQGLAVCEDGSQWSAKNILLSAPLPQSLDLLRASNISYPQALDEIRYAKALVALVQFEDPLPSELSQISYQDQISEDLYSVSNQKTKEVSVVDCFTVVGSETFSETHFENNEAETLKHLIRHFTDHYKINPSKVKKCQLKKWRFSHPLQTFGTEYLEVKEGLFLVGDAFGGGSVNGSVGSAKKFLSDLQDAGCSTSSSTQISLRLKNQI